MIEFRGVTKRYPDGTVAVDELDLEVEAGRITVFVGPLAATASFAVLIALFAIAAFAFARRYRS